MISKFRWLSNHMIQAWKGKIVLNLFVLWALFASFSVLNIGVLAVLNFETLSQSWGSQVEMNVYLKPETASRTDLEGFISQSALVKAIHFISQESAIKGLQEQMASHAPDLLKDPELLQIIPASLQVEFKKSENRKVLNEQLGSLAKEIRARPEVEDVQYGVGWLEQFSAIVKVIRQIGISIFAMIFLGCMFMVLFVIRNSISSRREEIEIMELVGASQSYIRWPFVFEGVFFCVIAGGLSLMATSVLFEKFQQVLEQENLFFYIAHQIRPLSTISLFALMSSFILIGASAAAICVLRLNSGFSAAEKLGAVVE